MKTNFIRIAGAFLIGTLALAFQPAKARTLTPAEALQRAGALLAARRIAGSGRQPLPTATVATPDGVKGCYIFAENGSDGFLILSADDRGIPVLGYSDSGKLDAGNMPPQMKDWLQGYALQIAALPESEGDESREEGEEPEQRIAIQPMIETRWNQDAPYSNLCPDYMNGVKCNTGCANTAIAQVMRYHRWPDHGKGSLSSYTNILGRPVRLEADFENTVYDWGNMLPTYDSFTYGEQRTAVATLMAHLGIATRTTYAFNYINESGTEPIDVARALISYFRYSPNLKLIERTDYSPERWEELVYEELKAGRPLFYVGYGGGQGHAFVCDGYDGQERFHFNWGWGGNGDGFYALTALRPNTNTGIGGGSFNFTGSQAAIFGVEPAKGDERIEARITSHFGFRVDPHIDWRSNGLEITTLAADNDLEPGFHNSTLAAGKIPIQFGGLLVNQATGIGYVVEGPTEEMSIDSSIQSFHLQIPDSIPDGIYSLTPTARIADSGEETPGTWTQIEMPQEQEHTATVELDGYCMKAYNGKTEYGILRARDIECPEGLAVGEPLQLSASLQASIDYYWGRLGVGIYDAESMKELFMYLGDENVTVQVENPYSFTAEVKMPRTPGRYRVMLCDDFYAPFAEAGVVEVKDKSGIENVSTEGLNISITEENIVITGATPGEEIMVYGVDGSSITHGPAGSQGCATLKLGGRIGMMIIKAGEQTKIIYKSL